MAFRVLVVDDSQQFRAAAAELLADRGFEVLAAAGDVDEALNAVAAGCPDGVLLDINLPGTDGFSVAMLLAVACPNARIVLTSANVAYVSDDLLRGCTAKAFVSKEELAGADLDALFEADQERLG